MVKHPCKVSVVAQDEGRGGGGKQESFSISWTGLFDIYSRRPTIPYMLPWYYVVSRKIP